MLLLPPQYIQKQSKFSTIWKFSSTFSHHHHQNRSWILNKLIFAFLFSGGPSAKIITPNLWEIQAIRHIANKKRKILNYFRHHRCYLKWNVCGDEQDDNRDHWNSRAHLLNSVFLSYHNLNAFYLQSVIAFSSNFKADFTKQYSGNMFLLYLFTTLFF